MPFLHKLVIPLRASNVVLSDLNECGGWYITKSINILTCNKEFSFVCEA